MEMIFLPYASFRQSAACLDDQTLSQQIGAAREILLALLFPPHPAAPATPAVQMWHGYERHLCGHGIALCVQRQCRQDGDDTLLEWFRSQLLIQQDKSAADPPWLGDGRLHSSHRGRLLAIKPEHYRQFGWTETPQDDEGDCWWPNVQNRQEYSRR